MDRLPACARNTYSKSTIKDFSSEKTKRKIDSLEKTLDIFHCDTSTLLSALKLSCSFNGTKTVEPGVYSFSAMLSDSEASPAEMQVLQDRLISRLPFPLKDEAQAIMAFDNPDARQAEEKLTHWVTVNWNAAKLLERITEEVDITLIVSLLRFMSDGDDDDESALIQFNQCLKIAQNEHLCDVAIHGVEPAIERDAFNDAVKTQLSMLFPPIIAEYRKINLSSMDDNEKKNAIRELIGFHWTLNQAIEEISSDSDRPGHLVKYNTLIALCNNKLFTTPQDMGINPGMLIEFRNFHVEKQDILHDDRNSADSFEEALMHHLVLDLGNSHKNLCMDIMDRTQNMVERKRQIIESIAGHVSVFSRMNMDSHAY